MKETHELDKHDSNRSAQTEAASSLTRRQWFLRLGEAAVLAGFSGVAAEDLSAIDAPEITTEAAHVLPPGLYGPSPAHMAHALTRDQRFISPPPGSETEYVTPNSGTFEPAFFSHEDYRVVRQLVRVMLNSPGEGPPPAGIAAVPDETVDEIAQWIDLVVREAGPVREAARALSAQHRTLAAHYYGEEEVRQLESDDEQKTWSEGLAWLTQEAAKLSAHGYLSLTQAQQAELLSSAGGSPSHKHDESAEARFYRTLKRRTIEGYYTSQAGLKELDYQGNAFHAESPGCPQK